MTLSKRAAKPQPYGAHMRRLRRELNNTRLTLLVALLFTILVAAIFPTPSIRFMVALLAAGPLVGAAAARFLGSCVRASRTLPETAYVGDVVNGRVEVRNAASHPIFWVQAHMGESPFLPDETPPVEAIHPERLVALLRAGERLDLPVQWHANRRGVWAVSAVTAGASDPLGLSAFVMPRTAEHTLTVLPRPVPLVRLGFLAGVSGAPSPARSSAVTEAMDFHGIRAWRPGEGVRRAHWKSTARTGQLHVIEWEEDLSGDVSVLLDVEAPVGIASGEFDGALETAVTIAASVAAHVLETGQQFELFCWIASPDGIQLLHHCARGANGLAPTLRCLAQAQIIAGNDTNLELLAQECGTRISSNSGIVLLTANGSSVGAAGENLAAAGIAARRCSALRVEREVPAKTPVLASSRLPKIAKSSEKATLNSGVLIDDAPSRMTLGMRTRTLHAGASISEVLEKDF